ncbi:hypothetical protein D9599_24635 [Roseomonas sp. KE2513]|nr:hypothetical protein [Roseomonas sp. KE2513]
MRCGACSELPGYPHIAQQAGVQHEALSRGGRERRRVVGGRGGEGGASSSMRHAGAPFAVPPVTVPAHPSTTRERSSGWTTSAQMVPSHSSNVWPVKVRQLAESSRAKPSASVVQTVAAVAATSAQKHSSLPRTACSAFLRLVTSRTNSTTSTPTRRGVKRPHQREPFLRRYCFS